MGLTGDDKKKYQRDYMANKRSSKGLTNDGSNKAGLTLLKRPNGEPYNPEEKMSNGSLRYMGPFSDGQVLDRLTVPIIDKSKIPEYTLQCLRAVVNAKFTPCKGRDPKRLRVELTRHIRGE